MSGVSWRRVIALVIPFLISFFVRAASRPAVSCLTFFHTHSSGLSVGEYGGRKNRDSRPSWLVTNALVALEMWDEGPSTKEKYSLPRRVTAESMLMLTRFPVPSTMGVRPTGAQVVPAW